MSIKKKSRGKFGFLRKEFLMDKEAIEKGAWIPFPGGNGERIRITKWEGPLHRSKIQDVVKIIANRYKGRLVDTETSIEALREICIHALVTDWEKVIDPDTGKEVKFSKQELRECLEDPDTGDEVTMWIVMQAKTRANYQIFEVEGDVGN